MMDRFYNFICDCVKLWTRRKEDMQQQQRLKWNASKMFDIIEYHLSIFLCSSFSICQCCKCILFLSDMHRCAFVLCSQEDAPSTYWSLEWWIEIVAERVSVPLYWCINKLYVCYLSMNNRSITSQFRCKDRKEQKVCHSCEYCSFQLCNWNEFRSNRQYGCSCRSMRSIALEKFAFRFDAKKKKKQH